MKNSISLKGYMFVRQGQFFFVSFLTLIFCTAFLQLHAQQTQRSIVNPAGETSTHARASLSWTLGDLAAGHYLTPSLQYREGFQSASLQVTSIDALPAAWKVDVYPNPAQTSLSIALKGSHSAGMLRLYDLSGRTVRSVDVAAGADHAQLRLDRLPAGSYMLHILDANGRSAGSYQIKKIH